MKDCPNQETQQVSGIGKERTPGPERTRRPYVQYSEQEYEKMYEWLNETDKKDKDKEKRGLKCCAIL